jgi:glycopeptide antibiotics resistance protein
VKKNYAGLHSLVLGGIGIFYFDLLYKYLLTPTVPSFNHVRPINLVPFRTIAQNLTDGGTPLSHRAYELIGNILMMAPIGVFLALKIRSFNVWPVVLIGVSTSTVFEVTQYLRWTWRVADIDDVICNSSGAVVAYLVTAYILHLYRPDRYPALRTPDKFNSVGR